MGEKKRSLFPGVFLIAIGLWLLVRRFVCFQPFQFRIYPILFILFALFLFVETFRRNHSGAFFWGIVLFFIGGFYFLRNFEIIHYFYADEYWPIFLLAPGVGFIALFIRRPKEWGVLIPGGLLLFFGLGALLRTFHGYLWGMENFIEAYWPVVLILIGLGVFLSGFQKHPRQ